MLFGSEFTLHMHGGDPAPTLGAPTQTRGLKSRPRHPWPRCSGHVPPRRALGSRLSHWESACLPRMESYSALRARSGALWAVCATRECRLWLPICPALLILSSRPHRSPGPHPHAGSRILLHHAGGHSPERTCSSHFSILLLLTPEPRPVGLPRPSPGLPSHPHRAMRSRESSPPMASAQSDTGAHAFGERPRLPLRAWEDRRMHRLGSKPSFAPLGWCLPRLHNWAAAEGRWNPEPAPGPAPAPSCPACRGPSYLIALLACSPGWRTAVGMHLLR